VARTGGGIAAIFLGVIVLGCPATGAVGTGGDALDALRVIPAAQPMEAPGFTLPAVAGPSVALQAFRGKVVLLNFWATWCGPCRREMPAIERLHRAYRDRGLAVLAVDFRESKEQVKAFSQELGLTFPALLDANGEVTFSYGARALPVTFLVGRDGKILWKAIGRREWDGPAGRAYFDQLLAGAPRP
jgi:thiol-disulfide isomerase/thioredoxin